MKKGFLRWFVLVVVLSISACSEGQNKVTYVNLSPSEFSEKVKELPSAHIIDVRTPEEYSKGHLLNAVNINWNGGDFEEQVLKLDKSAPVFIYCLSGGRSSAAANKMRSLGFTEIYEMKGGITKWRSEGFPENSVSLKSPGMTMEQYNDLLDNDKLVLVDFYAKWCGPCKKMEPYLKELKKEMKKKVEIVRIDIDENQEVYNELKLDALPVLMLYKDKKLVWSHAGFIGKEEVQEQLKLNIGH